METVRTYSQTVAKVHRNPGILSLVAEFRNNAQQQITKGKFLTPLFFIFVIGITKSYVFTGMSLRWEHFVNSFDSRHHQLPYVPGTTIDNAGGKHALYVREFASVVSVFQDRTDSLIDMYTEITSIVDQLATCPYTTEAFSELLGTIQKTIDKLNLEGYTNLDSWVAELDKSIEKVLVARLEVVIQRWCTEFNQDGDSANRNTGSLASRKKAIKDAKVRSISSSAYCLGSV